MQPLSHIFTIRSNNLLPYYSVGQSEISASMLPPGTSAADRAKVFMQDAGINVGASLIGQSGGIGIARALYKKSEVVSYRSDQSIFLKTSSLCKNNQSNN